jgi:hypothetical protein
MSTIWKQFKSNGIPGELVDKLEVAFVTLKENFYLGKHKPSELEGGHLAEIVMRILQWATGGLTNGRPYTPLGTPLPKFDQEVRRLESTSGAFAKSLRVHIPRVLLAMFDVRNGRGVGHPGGDVDPNIADSTLVAASADWVLAELVRLYHGVTLQQAQTIVDGLVERRVPIVEMFGDFPKVLRVDLSNPTKALIILYVRGTGGASAKELGNWLKVAEKEGRRILKRHDESALVHFDEEADRGFITRAGVIAIENRIDLTKTL